MFLPLVVSVVLMSPLAAFTPSPALESAQEKKPAPAPASAPASGPRTVEIAGGDDMKYSVTTIPAKAGETLRIRLVSKGTLPKVAMAHNVVVLKPGSKQLDFVNAAAMARATDFIPAEMKDQVLAATTLAGPGETVEVVFKVPAVEGNVPFVCTFPGHFAAGMRGNIVVKK
jgi:azurin